MGPRVDVVDQVCACLGAVFAGAEISEQMCYLSGSGRASGHADQQDQEETGGEKERLSWALASGEERKSCRSRRAKEAMAKGFSLSGRNLDLPIS